MKRQVPLSLFDLAPFTRKLDKPRTIRNQYDFPVLFGNYSFEDHVFKKRMSLELFLKHNGLEINENGLIYTVEIEDLRNNKIVLEVYNYIGISIGATHYYGKLHLPKVNYLLEDKVGNKTMNWPRDHRIPEELEIHRILTKEEIKNNPERFGKSYQPGEYFHGFDKVEDVILRAKEFTRYHLPGFKLEINIKD